MLFNAVEFWVFYAGVLLAWALVRGHLRARNWLAVVVSYVFYAGWDYRYSGLLLFSSLLAYGVGVGMGCAWGGAVRRGLMILGVAGNLGVLVVFKYLGFFRESVMTLLGLVGWADPVPVLGWVLPVGISFYTFQAVGYIVDVYRRDAPVCRDLPRFLAFVAFFPQLVAGPIERAQRLLPQFAARRRVTAMQVESGLWLVLWGLFKKVAIADSLSPHVGLVFDGGAPTAPMLAMGAVAFAVQIYCDFSGYTDIARGTARWLGIELMLNFRLPYWVTDLREFWRCWHMSLSTWLRDYLFIPLGGSRGTESRTALNLLITLVLGGLWHGAGPGFILFGLWHAAGLMAHRWWRRGAWARLPGPLGWLLTMIFVGVGWVFFRAQSMDQLLVLVEGLSRWSVPVWGGTYVWQVGCLSLPLLVVQGWQYRTGEFDCPPFRGVVMRGLVFGILFLGVLAFWEREPAPFIYFQF
jgi:alginate O-acetyltransferase complex protein AlgI